MENLWSFQVNVIFDNYDEELWFADNYEEICKDLTAFYPKEKLEKVKKIEIYPLTDEE